MNEDQDQNLNLDQTDDNNDALGTSSNDNTDVDVSDDDTGAQQQVDDTQEQHRPSRRERRQERYENFQSMRDDFNRDVYSRQNKQDQYRPMDYNKSDELDVRQLETDRTTYGDSRYAQGIQEQRFIDQQDRFYDRLETDADYVATRYDFLDEGSDKFDPDLLSSINRSFMQAAGFDNRSKTFTNPSIRYKTHVANYMADLERYAALRNADSSRNIAQQRSRQGVRPTGSASHKTLGELKPGDISKMSAEEFAKHEKQIDAQINAMLK